MVRDESKGIGTLSIEKGVWVLRVGPKRERAPLPGIALNHEVLANRRADVIAARFKRRRGACPCRRSAPSSSPMTRYFEWRASRVKRVGVLKGQFFKWIVPRIESLPMQAVDQAICKGPSLRFDGAVERGELSWKTACNVWTIWSKGLDDATRCKDASLCVLNANPAPA